MNKLFTKIIGVCLGLTMAVGVGVAVSANQEAIPAHASPETGFTPATMTAGTNGSSCKVNTFDGIKVGTASKGGDMSITVPSGSTKLVLYAAAWKSVSGLSLNISKTSGAASATISPSSIDLTADNGISNNSPFTLSGTESNYRFELTLANITADTIYKFAGSATKRFVVWSAQTQSAATYTISYNANGGSGTMSSTTGSDPVVAACTFTPPSNKQFSYWHTTSSGTGGTTYAAGDTPKKNLSLYAIWQVASAPAVTVSPTAASGYRGQTVTLTATPNAYITPTKYVWTTTNASIAKLGSSSSTTVETTTNTIVVTYGGDSASNATVTVKGVDESSSTETSAVSCAITVTASAHSLTLSPNTAQSIAVGGSVNVTATSTGSGAYSSANVTATTSNSSKVTVDGGTTATKASGSSFTLGGVAGGSATITFTTTNGDSETISVSVETSIYGTYKLCTSDSDLEEGAFYIIGTSGSDGKAVNFMSTEVRSNNKGVISATVRSSQIDVKEVESGENVMVVKLGKSGSFWTLTTKNYSDTTQGYLGSNASNNQLKLLTTLSDNAKFNISIDPTSHIMTAEAQSGASKYIRYNSSNTPPLISCYSSSSSQAACYLYKMIDVVPISSLTIPSTYGSGGDFYEGQEWTVSPTYNPDATTKTSELQIVSGGSYIEVSGLKVTAKVGAITSGTTVSATVKAVATDGSGTESNNCVITITKASVTGVEVTTNPTKTSYVEGQTLDLTGMVVTLTWNHGGTTTISGAASGLTTTPSLSTHLTVADHDGIEVSVTYAGITSGFGDGFKISVVTKRVSSIKEWTGQTTSYAIDSKLVADGSIVVVYNDETESDPLSVATLWANGEVTFKLGGTSVTPGSTTLSFSDNGKSLTITYSGHQKSVTIQVRTINYQFLTRVESTDDLVAGETYIIAGFETADDITKTYVMSSQASGKPDAIEWTDSWHDEYKIGSVNYPVDSLRADLASYGWTLGGVEGAWTFTSIDGNLLGYGTSGTDFVSGGTNHEFSISANGTNGYWKVQFNASGSTTRGVVFRGGSTMKFGAYAISNVGDSGEYHYVEIYRVYDVATSALENWSDTIDFIDEINCHDSGYYDFDTGKSWSTMESAFNDLDIEVMAYIKHASYKYDGVDTTATFGTDSDVAKFVCKYDYIVDKYKWNDFIGRDGTTYDLFNGSTRISHLGIFTTDRSVISVVVVISVISISAIGGYFFLRKRKEN